MSALQTVRETEGLADYLNAVERRLADVVHAHPGVVASVGSDALSAGGKRLRPTLTFLSAAPDADAPVVEGAADDGGVFVGRYQHDRHGRILGADGGQAGQAVVAGHVQVEQDQVDVVA